MNLHHPVEVFTRWSAPTETNGISQICCHCQVLAMLLLKVSDVPGPEMLVFDSIQCKEQLNLMLLQLADGEQLRSAFHGFNPSGHFLCMVRTSSVSNPDTFWFNYCMRSCFGTGFLQFFSWSRTYFLEMWHEPRWIKRKKYSTLAGGKNNFLLKMNSNCIVIRFINATNGFPRPENIGFRFC